MSASLVGSEMCIRDSRCTALRSSALVCAMLHSAIPPQFPAPGGLPRPQAVSYTHLTLPTICSV
eukprot:7054388-Alexandrium_andersonii.AAC.1